MSQHKQRMEAHLAYSKESSGISKAALIARDNCRRRSHFLPPKIAINSTTKDAKSIVQVSPPNDSISPRRLGMRSIGCVGEVARNAST